MTNEHAAFRPDDVRKRLTELEAVRDRLLPDQDDPVALSELTTVESEIAACQETLG
jgi:hypothetical protein